MNVEISKKEQILIENARKLSDEQLDKLLSFIETVVDRQKARDAYFDFSKKISEEVQQKGLTFEMLQDILKEADANRI